MALHARRHLLAVLLSGWCWLAATDSCSELTDLMTHLSAGFWAPAVVFRSLQVTPERIFPPNRTKLIAEVGLPGLCHTNGFPAASFNWQKPTSEGGDWIAVRLDSDSPVKIALKEYSCPLTALAITTSGWPSLRLQFDKCPRKTAVEVPLVNSSENGVKLVQWMCKVSLSTDPNFCNMAMREAGMPAIDLTLPGTEGQSLDLRSLATLASRGLTRMQVFNGCFENLDWYVSSTPLGIDLAEWAAFMAMTKALRPMAWPAGNVQLPAELVVESVCAKDCDWHMADKCLPHVVLTTTAAPPTLAPVEVSTPLYLAPEATTAAPPVCTSFTTNQTCTAGLCFWNGVQCQACSDGAATFTTAEQCSKCSGHVWTGTSCMVQFEPMNLPECGKFWSGDTSASACSFDNFIETGVQDPEVLPWLAYIAGSCFLLGACCAACCTSRQSASATPAERKIKQVHVSYEEDEHEHTFHNPFR